MKRIFLIATVVSLVLAPAAFAKGPSVATITGPGLSKPIKIAGNSESGWTGLGVFTEHAGFFPSAFGQDPNPMLAARPKGDLGPKYTIDYTVPSGDPVPTHLTQDVYPYARVPVTYMAPGQKIFGATTHGGWYQASPELKRDLVKGGLPATPVSSSSSDSAGFFSTGQLGLLLVALVLLSGTTIAIRRRSHRTRAA